MKKTFSLVVAIAFLFTFQSAARAVTFGDLSPYWSFAYGDGGGIPADVTNTAGQQPLSNGVKLFGDFGPIDGARFGSSFVLYWSGAIEGPTAPGDIYVADITFNAHATGGSLAWSFFSEMSSSEFSSISTDLMAVPPSGQVIGTHLESSPFTTYGENGAFHGYLHIDWSGYSPNDTFTMSIPQNSIDISYHAVPEPSAALPALVACASGFLWRRR
jgi:hypothetical protein